MTSTEEQPDLNELNKDNNNGALTCSRDETKPGGVECLTIELSDKDTRESVLSKALAINKRLREKYDWLEKADQMLDKCIGERHTWVSKSEFLERVKEEAEPETKNVEEILKIIENEIGYQDKEERFRSLFLEQERYQSYYERSRARDIDQGLLKEILAVNEFNKTHRATTKEFGEQLLALKIEHGKQLIKEIKLVRDNKQLVKEKEELNRRLIDQIEISNTKLKYELDSVKNYKKLLSKQQINQIFQTTATRSTQTSSRGDSNNGWYTEPTIEKDDLRDLDDTGDEENKEKSTKKKKRGRRRRNRKQTVPANANGSTDCEEQITTTTTKVSEFETISTITTTSELQTTTTTTTTTEETQDELVDDTNDIDGQSVKVQDDEDEESRACEEQKENVPRKSFSKIFSCWNYSNNQEMSDTPTQYSLWG